jgi:hypothetical protein
MNVDEKERSIKGRYMVDAAQLDVMAREVAEDGADAQDGDTTAIGECDR